MEYAPDVVDRMMQCGARLGEFRRAKFRRVGASGSKVSVSCATMNWASESPPSGFRSPVLGS